MRRSNAGTRNVLIGAAVLPLIALIAGCGSSTTSTPVTTTSSSQAKTAPPATPAAHVGSTLRVADGNGGTSNVTLREVIDPASAGPYITPTAGQRFIGAKVTITNTGTAALTGDANSDVTVVGSDDQTYTANFSSIAGCTNFASGEYTLASGQSATGCVTFQLPTAVKVVEIEDTPGGFGGNGSITGIWKV